MKSILSIALLLLQLAATGYALTHMHRGPTARSGAPAVLRGSAVVDSYWGRGRSVERKRIGWTAQLKRDIVTWYELSDDGTSIRSCSGSQVTIAGPKLDRTDYAKGTVFVIDRADWEKLCAIPKLRSGIPEEDDVLFYEITAKPTVAKDSSITLPIRIISGEGVVPVVDLDVSEQQGEPAPRAKNGEVQFFRTNAVNAVSRQSLMMPTSVRALGPLGFNSTITTGVSLGFNAGVEASIRKFRLKRLRGLRFGWEQRLAAEAGAFFEITKTLEKTATGRILQVPVPGFGFRTRRIPFVGRASAGAFVRVDWVLELVAETKLSASFNIRREIRHSVDAKIFPPNFNPTDLPPLKENSQSSSLQLGAEGSINGFAGVRPALGIEVGLGRKSAGGNIGVKLGLEVETRIKTPPFEPFTGGGIKLGVCDKCHSLQGFLGVRIKDLTLQLERNDKVEREVSLVEDIFGVPIATICAIPRPNQCSATNPELPGPVELPQPTQRCRVCNRGRKCPRGFKCVRRFRLRMCVRQLRLGAKCGQRCTRCKTGACKATEGSSKRICKK